MIIRLIPEHQNHSLMKQMRGMTLDLERLGFYSIPINANKGQRERHPITILQRMAVMETQRYMHARP